MSRMMSISNKDFNYINVAIEASTKSTMLMRHGCVVVENNKIVGTGYNSYRTRFGDRFVNETCSCHAEMHALRETMKMKSRNHSRRCGTLKVANGTKVP